MVRTQERRIFYLRRAENPPAADDRLSAANATRVPKIVRRAGCCGVCRTPVPDSRAYCSYCVRYVN